MVVLLKENLYDVIIVGGGPAGLSAALTLGRSCRNTLLIDNENPRSHVTLFSHGYLTRDGCKPLEFRQIAGKELAHYPTLQFERDTVETVHKKQGSFQITTQNGNHFLSRKLLFATGLRDVLPDIDELRDVYGISAFICPYCDGWEYRGEPIAIIGSKLSDIHFVKALHGWSKDIILFTNGPHQLKNEQLEGFSHHGIPIYEDKIKCLEHKNGELAAIVLDDGVRIPRKVIFFNPGVQQASLLPQQLGVPLDDLGLYQTEESGKTVVDGLYIAGDSRNHLHQIIHAASDGAKAAVGINMELLKEDWKQFD